MPEISETGVFVDSKTGQIVHSQPEEGVQLVPPGSEITPAMKDAIKAAELVAAGGGEVANAVTTSDVEHTTTEADEAPAKGSKSKA